jgi:predicted outer membrane protein
MADSGRWSRCALAALIAALVLPATPARAAGGSASATDLQFVRRLHLTTAGVGAASALARQMSATDAVKKLAAQVSRQNDELDDLTRSTAATLKVPLTDPLPADQQTALGTLQQSSGAAFDAGYVGYLWHADGTLLPISTAVTGTTRSVPVRRLAQRAGSVVAAQLPMLQNSGRLDMAILPTPSASNAAVTRLPGGVPMDHRLMARTRSGSGFLSPALWVRLSVLVVTTGVALALTWRLLHRSGAARGRGRRRVRPGPTGPDGPGRKVRGQPPDSYVGTRVRGGR